MTYAIYFVAFYLGFVAFALAQMLEKGESMDQPTNPALVRWAARLGIASVLMLSVFGFSKLAWYLPLLALLPVVVSAGSVCYRARRSTKAPSIVILWGSISVVLTLLLFQLVD